MEIIAVDLDHPLVASVLLPLVLAVGLTAALRLTAGMQRGRRIAASAAGLALLVTHLMTFGAPAWPPQSGIQKLAPLFALLLVGGSIIDLLPRNRLLTVGAACVAVLVISLWLAWPQLSRAQSGLIWLLVPSALLGLAGLTGLTRAPHEGAIRPAMIVVAALALAGASLNAGSLVLMQVALALAAAFGGFALWNWPAARLPFHAAGIAVGGLGCFAVALLLLLLTDIPPWALLPIPLIFAADLVSHRLPVPARFTRSAVEPVYVVLIGLLPLLAAVLLAQPPTTGDDLYYR